MQVPTREPALDGLRGLAMVMVVVGHATLYDRQAILFNPLKELGWMGVDLFFVLSGYLITRSLLSGGSLLKFFRNRAIKILPLYWFALVLFGVVLPSLFPDGPAKGMQWMEAPLAHGLFFSNLHTFAVGRFLPEPLSVGWSLAMEVQFYAIWPLVVRALPRSWLPGCCVVLAVVSAILRMGLVANGANELQVFVFPLGRLEPMLLGSLVATLEQARTLPRFAVGQLHRAVALFGLLAAGCFGVGVLWPGLRIYATTLNYSFFTGLFVCLLLLALNRTESRESTFAGRCLRRFGLYSYGIYLFNLAIIHGLVLVGIRPGVWLGPWLGQGVLYAVVIPVCFAAGWLAFHAVEQPCQRLKKIRLRSSIVGSVPAKKLG